MNPARSLGPAIWNNSYSDHWIYWIAPISAAILTAVTYKLVFRRELPKEVSKDCEDFPLKAAA
jgi:aquaporin rerated protein, invertebrate